LAGLDSLKKSTINRGKIGKHVLGQPLSITKLVNVFPKNLLRSHPSKLSGETHSEAAFLPLLRLPLAV